MWPQLMVRICGVLAYGACICLWVGALGPFIPMLLDSDPFQTYVGTNQTPAVVQVSSPERGDALSGLWFMVAIVIAAAVLFVTILSFARLPRAVGRVGSRVTRATADLALPIVAHSHKLPPKQRRRLSARLVMYAKLGLVVLPVAVAFVAPRYEQYLPADIYLLLICCLACWALIWFAAELLLAKACRLDLSKIW